MIARHRVHTTLPVADLDKAREFYEGTLGYSPFEITPSGVIYKAGAGSVFAITRSSGKPSGSHTQMGITVEDIDAEVAELKRKGIVFEEYDVPGLKTVGSIAQAGPNRAAWFYDPDGNMIGIIQFA
jgi:catechol 2,3-dioxygenase-like lactoylglutathione lyase family enzyme